MLQQLLFMANLRPCRSLWERWHGEAVTERAFFTGHNI